MSYILDALKKSEQERAMGNVPSLRAAGRGAGGRKVPLSWFIVCLVLVAGAFGAYEWRTAWLPGGDADHARRNVPVEEPRAAAVQAPAGADAVTAVDVDVLSRPEEPLLPLKKEQVARPAAASPVPASEVPTLAELGGEVRSRIPPLSVNVLSYSSSEPKRFAMINQNIYKQGQDMGNGIVVEEIRRSDVVLSFQGVRFRLAP